jgi:nucleoside-diphosphate-sugar epimerase
LADIGRAEEQLGYKPLVELGDGLRQTVQHLRELGSQAASGSPALP